MIVVNFSFHISIHNCTLILLSFAPIFGQSMHLLHCVSCDHDQLSYRVVNFHVCAHRSCSGIAGMHGALSEEGELGPLVPMSMT